MDFRLPEEIVALQSAAREVAADAVRRLEIREDSWVVGFSKDFSASSGRADGSV